jgi:hypothetical protein
MNEKTQKVASFREYLQELNAREKSATLREYTDRLLFQDTVREALDRLKDEGFIIYEGLIRIAARREKIEVFKKPDFTVSKEDILFQLYLVPNEERGMIERDFLRGLFDVIQTDPKITALIAVWNFEDLPSCALDAFIFRKYIEIQEDRISLRNERISGLGSCIKDFYDAQFVDWSIPEGLVIVKEGEKVPFTIKDLLSRCLDEELHELQETSFKILEKKEAKEAVLKVDKDKILDRLAEFLAKPELGRDDFDKFESFLDRALKRTKVEDD